MQILIGISHFKFKNGGQVLKWRRGDTSEDWRCKAYTSAVFSPLRARDGYRSPDSIYKKTSKSTYAAIFLKPLSVLAQWVYIYIYIYLFSRI